MASRGSHMALASWASRSEKGKRKRQHQFVNADRNGAKGVHETQGGVATTIVAQTAKAQAAVRVQDGLHGGSLCKSQSSSGLRLLRDGVETGDEENDADNRGQVAEAGSEERSLSESLPPYDLFRSGPNDLLDLI